MATYDYITQTGVIVADTQDLLTTVENEYKAIFGQDLIVDPSTPQGMLIAAETQARKTVIDNNAALANQINPNIAGGVFLDAIMALTGIARSPKSYSFTTVNLAGVPGTVIPEGVQINDGFGGPVFESQFNVTLNGTGNATVEVVAVDPGPIAALANTLTNILVGPLGLETVTNPSDAVLGSLTQSDSGARNYRTETLAFQGSRLSLAMTSGLYATPNVKSVLFRENVASTSQTIDGILMLPHSLYVCVAGGTDTDVANTILNKKNGGCDYNNGYAIPVNVTLIDPYSGQSCLVKFDRPNLIAISAKVYIKVDSSVQDPETAVINAILDYANGNLTGESGFKIGASVSAFELAGAVNVESPGIFVNLVEIKKTIGGTFSTTTIDLAVFEQATIQRTAIQVILL